MMTRFDYRLPGEIFVPKFSGMRRSGLTYRRFETAAEAVRFAIETLPATALTACTVETDGKRLGSRELKALYADARYPLARKAREGSHSTRKAPHGTPQDKSIH